MGVRFLSVALKIGRRRRLRVAWAGYRIRLAMREVLLPAQTEPTFCLVHSVPVLTPARLEHEGPGVVEGEYITARAVQLLQLPGSLRDLAAAGDGALLALGRAVDCAARSRTRG